MAFFLQVQNNSGGHFFGPQMVVIEATNEARALEVLKADHLPFKQDAEIWCPCCGERWSFSSMDWEYPTLEEALEKQSLFGQAMDNFGLFIKENGEIYKFGPGPKSTYGRKVNIDSLSLVSPTNLDS